MRNVLILLAALAAVLSSGTASAQDRDLARRTEQAERYLRLTTGDDLRPLIEAMIEEQLAADVNMTSEQRAWYRANMPVFFDAFMESLIDLMAPRYAASMTEEELAAGIEFYSSPLGRSLASKEVALQIDVDEELYAAGEAMMLEITAKYCARFECEDLPTIVASGK